MLDVRIRRTMCLIINLRERISSANCFPQSKTVYKSLVQFYLFLRFHPPFTLAGFCALDHFQSTICSPFGNLDHIHREVE